jgi:hypothetical protein
MKMKFKLPIAGMNVLLTPDQLEEILELIADCECLNEEWVGDKKGDNGTSYKSLIRTCSLDRVQPAPVLNDQVEAMRLVTKLWDDERSAKN